MTKIIIIVFIVFVLYYVFLFIWNTFNSTQQKKIQNKKNNELVSFDDHEFENLIKKETIVFNVDKELEKIKQKKESTGTQSQNIDKVDQEKQNKDNTNEKKEENVLNLSFENKNLYQQLIYQLKLHIKFLTEKNQQLERKFQSSNSEYIEKFTKEDISYTNSTYQSGISVNDFFEQKLNDIMIKRSQELSSFNM